jgi:hypothetical protein
MKYFRPAFMTLAVASLLAACTRPDTPRVEGPLAIDIPELCTVCVEVLRCEGPARRAAYVLDEKDAWAQIATIWDYMKMFFAPKIEDFRDLTVYELAADLKTPLSARGNLKARLDVWNRRVELPDSVVVQKTGEWQSLNGAQIGSCTVLARGPDRELKRALEGGIASR